MIDTSPATREITGRRDLRHHDTARRASHPNLARWFKHMRTLPICAADARRARDYVAHMQDRDLERKRIFWRGDRIEWILARGFHPWFFKEIKEGRVLWPGPALPAPLNRPTSKGGIEGDGVALRAHRASGGL